MPKRRIALRAEELLVLQQALPPRTRILLFVPAALTGLAVELAIRSFGARPAWGWGVDAGLVAPAVLVAMGLLLSPSSRAVRALWIPLAILSLMLALGLVIERWPIGEGDRFVWLWLGALLLGPAVVSVEQLGQANRGRGGRAAS